MIALLANAAISAAIAVSASLALSLAVKATLLLGLGLAGVRLARRARAAARHAALASVFAVLLALPAGAIVAPPVLFELAGAPAVVDAAVFTGADVSRAANPVRVSLPALVDQPVRHIVSGWTIAVVVWIVGLVFCLTSLVGDAWSGRRWRRRGVVWQDGQAMVNRLIAAAGMRRRVETIIHPDTSVPLTHGFLHPSIVLPVDVTHWPAGEVHQALVHELAHVRRGDWLVSIFARTVCALYWFHPLVWLAARQLTLEAERACDDAVVAGGDRTVYAQLLVSLARRVSARTHGAVPAWPGAATSRDASPRCSTVANSGEPPDASSRRC